MLRAGLLRALLCSSSSSSVAAQQANVQWQSLAALPQALLGAATRCNLPAAATRAPHEAIQQQQQQQRGICSWQQPLGAWQPPHHHHHHHQLHTSAAAAVAPLAAQHVVQLNRLRPAPGSSSLVSRQSTHCCCFDATTTTCQMLVKGCVSQSSTAPQLLTHTHCASLFPVVRPHVRAEEAVGPW